MHQEYKSEINAFDRVSSRHIGQFTDIEDSALSDIQQKIQRTMQDPIGKFTTIVDAICRSFMDKGPFNISEADIIYITESIPKVHLISNVEHKNPTGFILGYLATNGGKNFDKKSINSIFSSLKKLNDKSISEPDVIRYGRFWLNNKF